MIQKEKINNWIIQFLKNETKTFLFWQKIFYFGWRGTKCVN